jgi:hypothetical protein
MLSIVSGNKWEAQNFTERFSHVMLGNQPEPRNRYLDGFIGLGGDLLCAGKCLVAQSAFRNQE